jgi:hypothetical protein
LDNNKDKSKRVVVGALILFILIGLNLLVRYNRASGPAQTPPISATPPAAVTSGTPSSLQSKTVAQPASQANPTNAATGNDVLIPAGAQQMAIINSRLDKMWQDLRNLAMPLPPPDLVIELNLSDYDRFRWKLALPIASEAPVIEPASEIATPTVTKAIEVLAVFRVKGRNKYLVREDERAFLVNEGEETRPDSIVVEKTGEDSYHVFDSGGSTHDLTLKKPTEDNVGRAINVLLGKDSKQTSYDLITTDVASITER